MLQEEETFLPSEQKESIFSEPLQVAFSEPASLQNMLNFQRRLISRVRKRRQLYDAKHELFKDIESKEKIWKKIAENLKADVEKCKNTWAELRYQYQRYVRRLRKFLLYGNTQRKRRPIMALENEMLFLWRHIPQCGRAPHPFAKPKPKEINISDDDDDDIVILDDEPVVIVLDDEDKNVPEASKTKFKILPEMRKLVELIKGYPELYDCDHQYFNDYRRKGIIWNAIANECNDKATKLMKFWIQLQTRFEWEILKNKSPILDTENDIRHVMNFLGPYITKNPNTVCKQSVFLKHFWHEPIDHFKNIYNLVGTMKRYPKIVLETEQQLSLPIKSTSYITAWSDIAKVREYGTSGQCEVTWLILRTFYWELMNMRKHSYQLQDKWYFENIITELYAFSTAATKAADNPTLPVVTALPPTTSVQAVEQNNVTIITPSLPTITSVSYGINASVSNSVNVPIGITVSAPISSPINVSTFSSNTQQMTLPKIVSAKSLAPTSTPSQIRGNVAPKGLQIVQLMPPNAMTVVPGNNNLLTNQKETSGIITLKRPLILPKPRLQVANVSQPTQPPQLSGPYPLPKIANVQTIASSPNTVPNFVQPMRNSMVTSTANLMPNSLPTLTQAQPQPQPRPMLNVTPTSLPMTMIPQMSQVTQFAQLPQLLPLSSNTQSSPTLTFRPVLGVNSQPILPSLPSVPCYTNFGINRLIPPPTNNLATQIQQPNPQEMQLLSGNEIMIELISSPNGNQLVVHGPPLSEGFILTMQKTSEFIREIMAIPLLHNKNYSQGTRVQSYWVFLASKFNMPAHVCRAVWNFLSENFNHFSKIAPMEELMKPFTTEAKAWQEGTVLFKKFLEGFNKKGWTMYEQKLPAVMEKIGKERALYQDLSKKNNVMRGSNCKKITEIWKKLRTEFNIDDIEEIWTTFKSVFWQYMHELEMGYENHWPIRLWRSLSKLDFLIRQRYHNMEPFYYIVRNKFNEEVEKCIALEQKVAEVPMFSLSAISSPCSYEIDAYNLLATIRRHSDIYRLSTTAQKEQAWVNVAKELNASVSACRLAFQRALKNYRIYMLRDPANRCRLNHRYFKHMHAIYRSVNLPQKLSIKTPTELNQSVTDAPDPNDTIFPERMIFDINVDSCSASLVLKNWAHGIGNCTPAVQNNLPDKLHALFEKYKNCAKVDKV